MKLILSLLLFIAAVTHTVAADTPTAATVVKKPGTGLKFPTFPAKLTPKAEVEIPVLRTGVFYIIQSPTPFIVGAVELTAVDIIMEEAPLKLGGVFIDGKDGKSEIRKYDTGFLAIIQARSQVLVTTTLVVVPDGAKQQADLTYLRIKVGNGPQPPPTPTPDDTEPVDVTPEPVVDPNALAVPDGFRVIFIHETADKITKEQYNIYNSPEILAYLNSKCAKNAAGNNSEWRKLDQNTDMKKEPSEAIRKIWAILQPEIAKNPLPQLLICVNGVGYLSALPATPEDTLARLKLKGGN